jgi:hypothetical protein
MRTQISPSISDLTPNRIGGMLSSVTDGLQIDFMAPMEAIRYLCKILLSFQLNAFG